MRRLRKFLGLSRRRRALLLEAAVLLAWSEFGIHVRKVSRLARTFGEHMGATPDEQPREHVKLAREVSWAVTVAARHVPWNSVCLPQALAARTMLRRRGVASTLYLGVSRAEGLTAHAWLRVGHFIVTGRDGMQAYEVISTFA
jgi:hypothetical protein